MFVFVVGAWDSHQISSAGLVLRLVGRRAEAESCLHVLQLFIGRVSPLLRVLGVSLARSHQNVAVAHLGAHEFVPQLVVLAQAVVLGGGGEGALSGILAQGLTLFVLKKQHL